MKNTIAYAQRGSEIISYANQSDRDDAVTACAEGANCSDNLHPIRASSRAVRQAIKNNTVIEDLGETYTSYVE
jgi:hypothetical protein